MVRVRDRDRGYSKEIAVKGLCLGKGVGVRDRRKSQEQGLCLGIGVGVRDRRKELGTRVGVRDRDER